MAGNGVEVTPIGKNDIECQISDPFSGQDIWDPSAIYTSLGILVCGGYHYSSRSSVNTCNLLDTSNNRWTPFYNLTQGRYGFSMNDFGGTILAIGGGKSGTSSEYIKMKKGTKWVETNLGLNIVLHCSVSIDKSRTLITGGQQNGSVSNLIIE